MLRNTIRISVQEVLSALHHLEALLKALRLADSSRRHDTVGIEHVAGAVYHAVDITGCLHELDGVAGGADGFAVAEGFAHPVDNAALLLERGDVLAAGDVD